MKFHTASIGSLAEVFAGGGAPQDSADFSTIGEPFVRAGSLLKLLNGASEESLEKIEAAVAKNHGLKLFPAGTVLFAKSGMSATKGHIYCLKKPSYVVNHLAALVPHDKGDCRFLVHALRRYSPTSLIQDAAYPSIRLSDIERMPLAVPVLASDRGRIAAILDQADDLRRKRREVIRRIDLLKDSIFADLLYRNQDKIKRVHFVNLANAQKNSFVNGPFGSDLLTTELTETGVPVIYIRDIRAQEYLRVSAVCVTEKKAASLAFCSVMPGDVLIAKVGDPPGLAAVYPLNEPPGIVTQDVVRFRANTEEIFPEYVAQFLNSSIGRMRLKAITVMATRARFSLTDLKKIQIDVLPLDVQIEFFNRVAEIDKLKAHHRAHLARLDALFASLQHRAFRGDLPAPSFSRARENAASP